MSCTAIIIKDSNGVHIEENRQPSIITDGTPVIEGYIESLK